MRGRTPKPAIVKEAQGNPGRRRIGIDPASARLTDDALAIVPSWLEGEARDIWNRLAPELSQLRLLSRPDAMTFARYCEWFAIWLKARASLAAADLVVETVSEHVTMDRLNKHLQAMLLVEKRLVDMEDRFGLNPANRQRIYAQRAAGGGAADPGAGDLFKRNGGEAPKQPPAQRSPIGMLQ